MGKGQSEPDGNLQQVGRPIMIRYLNMETRNGGILVEPGNPQTIS